MHTNKAIRAILDPSCTRVVVSKNQIPRKKLKQRKKRFSGTKSDLVEKIPEMISTRCPMAKVKEIYGFGHHASLK